MEKVEVRALVCPICANGEFDGADINENFIICPCCKKSFVAEIGKKLAKIEVDETNKLKNLHERLDEAGKVNNIDDINIISNEILNINKDSYLAKYFFAYAKRNRSETGYLYKFYNAAPKQSECSPSEARAIVEHLIKRHELGDYKKALSYVESVASVFGEGFESCVNDYCTEHEQRLAQESKYFDIIRDVFVCHKSEDYSKDKKPVLKIVEQIKKAGRSYWISEENLRKNDTENYWKSIEKAIKSCRVFLYVYSENARHSKDVHKELDYARALKKPIIEINVDGTKHYDDSVEKSFLDGNAWVDAYTDFDKGLASLSNRLHDTLAESLVRPNQSDGDFSQTWEYDLPMLDESSIEEQDLEPGYENGRRMLELAKYAGVDRCNKIAYRLFTAGAKETSDPKCYFEVARCLYEGIAVEKDENAAEGIFESYIGKIEEQANNADAEAMLLMAEYELKYADFPDKKKAEEWFDKACKAGSARARCLRALHYFSSPAEGVAYDENGEQASVFYDDYNEIVYDSSMQWADIEAAYNAGFHLAYYEYGNLLSLKETSSDHYDEDGDEEKIENLSNAKKIYSQGVKEANDIRCQGRLAELRLYKKGFEIFEGKLISTNEHLKNRRSITVPIEVSSVGPYAFNFEGIETLDFLGMDVKVDEKAFGEREENVKGITKITIGGDNVTDNILRYASKAAKEARLREKVAQKEYKRYRSIRNAKAFAKIFSPIIVIAALAVALAIALTDFIKLPHFTMIALYSAVVILGVVAFILTEMYEKLYFAIPFEVGLVLLVGAGILFSGYIAYWWIHLFIAILVAIAVFCGFFSVFGGAKSACFIPISCFPAGAFTCLMILASALNWINPAHWTITTLCLIFVAGCSIAILYIEIDEGAPSIFRITLLGLIQVPFLIMAFVGFVTAWWAILTAFIAALIIIFIIFAILCCTYENATNDPRNFTH